MTEPVVTEIATFEFPFNKHVNLKDVTHDNGLSLLRVTLRENRRFTIFELAPENARAFGETLQKWADSK